MNDGFAVEKSLYWNVIIIILFNAKVGIFPPSYAVKLSCFTTWIPTFKKNTGLFEFFVIAYSILQFRPMHRVGVVTSEK